MNRKKHPLELSPYEITYRSVYNVMKSIKFKNEGMFKNLQSILSEVAEKNRVWWNLDNKQFLDRVGLGKYATGKYNETNIKDFKSYYELESLINENEGWFLKHGRIYDFSVYKIIEDYDGKYFLLLTICLNNWGVEDAGKFLDYQYSIYTNKREFLENLELRCFQGQQENLIPSYIAFAVEKWMKKKMESGIKSLGKLSIRFEDLITDFDTKKISSLLNDYKGASAEHLAILCYALGLGTFKPQTRLIKLVNTRFSTSIPRSTLQHQLEQCKNASYSGRDKEINALKKKLLELTA